MKQRSQKPGSNTPVKAAPSGRWTLRDKAPRSAPYGQSRYGLLDRRRQHFEDW